MGYMTSTSDKSKWMAFWLCLFGGLFGFHNFYVGRIGRGILFIFTLGFVGIGWMVDLFKILFGSFEDNVGAPLRK